MMVILLNNNTIRLNVEFSQYEEQYTGYFEFSINEDHLKQMIIENNCVPAMLEEYIEYDYDTQEVKFLDDYDPNYNTNADLYIIYLNWLNENNIETVINCKCKEIFWLIHDYFHSKNDCVGFEVGTSAGVEEIRLNEAIDYMKENDLKQYIPDFYYLEKIENEFFERWKIPLEGSIIDYKEELEEEMFADFEDDEY